MVLKMNNFFLVILNFRIVSYYIGFIIICGATLGIVLGFVYYISRKVIFLEWEVYDLFGSLIIITLLVDWMSLSFIGFVRLISSIVLFYRTYYISGDKFLYRFIILVYLFVLSIILIIIRPNLVSILLGWDGLGLVSYCLVIYYQNVKSANAGILTILSNRVGDVAILLGISWLANYGGWNFYYLGLVNHYEDLLLIIFLVSLAAITKRAQIPFSAWLPAAIAAPTPVSALVHSSTLVTAGVYLLIRFTNVIGLTEFIFFIGVVTIFISGLGANFETDLKKIIALSTLSQLGVIIMILGLGYSELSFFHLLRHALFKSLLFLCAGVFIHRVSDIQDIRLIGGFWRELSVRSLFFMGCSISLCGAPFLSGFYSKDLILEVFELNLVNRWIYYIIFLGTIFTVTYRIRLGYYLYWKNLGGKTINLIREERGIIYPIRILFVLAVRAGSFMVWFYFPCYNIFLPTIFKISILFGIFLFSIMVVSDLFSFNLMNLEIPALKHFVGGIWFMPLLSVIFFIGGVKQGKTLLKNCDQGWYEYFGGQGINIFYSSIKTDSQLLINLKNFIWLFFLTLTLIILFTIN